MHAAVSSKPVERTWSVHPGTHAELQGITHRQYASHPWSCQLLFWLQHAQARGPVCEACKALCPACLLCCWAHPHLTAL